MDERSYKSRALDGASQRLMKPSAYLRMASMAAAIGLGVYTDINYLKSDYCWAGLVGGFVFGDAVDSFVLKPLIKKYTEQVNK